jgi:PadR family transcriptional regulator, regulatory protein PadR
MEDESLLLKWEENYKKGLLSFWILLLLHERPSYPFEMRPLIEEISQGTISADENSLYRALGRFQEMGIVTSQVQPNGQGPDRRYYRLTPSGLRLLQRFIARNIKVFETPEVSRRIQSIQALAAAEE